MSIEFTTSFIPLINNLNNSVGLSSMCYLGVTSRLPAFHIPAHAVEEYALAKSLGGGIFDPKILEVIPTRPSLVERTFTCIRKGVTKSLGAIMPEWGNVRFINTATKVKELLRDAKNEAPHFINGCNRVAKSCGGEANFGPNNKFAIKSEGSLKRKIIQDSKKDQISMEKATQSIGDSLRGTVVVDTPEQMKKVVAETNTWIELEGGKIVWKDLFKDERDDGYVGLHGKILMPFIDKNGKKRQINCELQVHFRSLADGSLESPKERMHLLYKTDDSSLSPKVAKSISMLSFLSGLISVGDTTKNPSILLSECQIEQTVPADLCKDKETSQLCEGNLGISRSQMPQIIGQTRRDYIKKKEEQGVNIQLTAVLADRLKPTQNELNGQLVYGNVNSFFQGTSDPCDREILTAKEYVVDGHHTWAACRLLNGAQKVITIVDSIENVLAELRFFSGIAYKNIQGNRQAPSFEKDTSEERYYSKEEQLFLLNKWGIIGESAENFINEANGFPGAYLPILNINILGDVHQLADMAAQQITKNYVSVTTSHPPRIIALLQDLSLDYQIQNLTEEDRRGLLSTGLVTLHNGNITMANIVKEVIQRLVRSAFI